MIPTIAISLGDFNGIGPEVILKALSKTDLTSSTPLIIGHRDVFEYYSVRSGLQNNFYELKDENSLKKGHINLLNLDLFSEVHFNPGSLSSEAGLFSMKAVEKGIDLTMNNICDALVTAPISKEAIQKAGYTVPGHTEFLAQKTSSKKYMMMLVNDHLRVGLATIHIPIKDVAGELSKISILNHLSVLNKSLIRDFSISDPSIAVLGLNPHAGDGGVIGDEELNIIKPALQQALFQNITVGGPFAADGFFGNKMYHEFDAILAMYHDQGLIPFKTLSFGQGVNFTAGLPIIRTSPDHGTAFNIAGKNQADERSFESAYKLAVTLSKNRQTIYKS